MSNKLKVFGGKKPAPQKMQIGCGVSTQWPFNVAVTLGNTSVEIEAVAAFQFGSAISGAAMQSVLTRLGALTRPDDTGGKSPANGDSPQGNDAA